MNRRANPFSSALAGRAVALIVEHLPRAVEDPDDPQPRGPLALASTMAGAAFSVAGVIMTPVEIPWALVLMKNLTLRGGLVNPQRHVQRLLPLIESGRLDPTELITHRMPLSDAVAGYELFAERRDGVLKIVLEPEGA